MNEEGQRNADEAAWSEGRIQCAAVRDVRLDEARNDIRAIDAAWSAYHDSCVAIDDRWDAARAKRGAGRMTTREELVKDVDTAMTAWHAADDGTAADWHFAAVAWDVAKAALADYDEGNT
jgi:hypothetical protein